MRFAVALLAAWVVGFPAAQAATLLEQRGLQSIERLIEVEALLERDSTSPTFQTFLAGGFGSEDQIVLSGTVVPEGDTVGLFAAKDGSPLTSDGFGGMGGAFLANIASAGSSDLIEFLFERSAPEPGLLYVTVLPLAGTDFGPAPLSFAEAATFTVPVQLTLDEVAAVSIPSTLSVTLLGFAAMWLTRTLSRGRRHRVPLGEVHKGGP